MLRVVAKISLSSRLDFPRVPHIVLQHSRPTSPPSSIGSPTSSQLRYSVFSQPAVQVFLVPFFIKYGSESYPILQSGGNLYPYPVWPIKQTAPMLLVQVEGFASSVPGDSEGRGRNG